MVGLSFPVPRVGVRNLRIDRETPDSLRASWDPHMLGVTEFRVLYGPVKGDWDEADVSVVSRAIRSFWS